MSIPMLWREGGITGGALLSLDYVWKEVRSTAYLVERRRRTEVLLLLMRMLSRPEYGEFQNTVAQVLRLREHDQIGILEQMEADVYGVVFGADAHADADAHACDVDADNSGGEGNPRAA